MGPTFAPNLTIASTIIVPITIIIITTIAGSSIMVIVVVVVGAMGVVPGLAGGRRVVSTTDPVVGSVHSGGGGEIVASQLVVRLDRVVRVFLTFERVQAEGFVLQGEVARLCDEVAGGRDVVVEMAGMSCHVSMAVKVRVVKVVGWCGRVWKAWKGKNDF